MTGGTFRIEPLTSDHDVRQFDCGRESLNLFLHRYALMSKSQGLSQTWVAVAEPKQVLAYYTLGFVSIDREGATPRVGKGVPNYQIPCVLLARLAVDRSVQGQGIGGHVLETAMRRAVALGNASMASDNTPVPPLRAMLVHAIDETAAGFYRKYGFESSPTDPLHLLILLKDLRKSLRL